MGLFDSHGQVTEVAPARLDAVRQAIYATVTTDGHPVASYLDQGPMVRAVTKRTALNWGTQLVFQLTEGPSGTQIVVHYDNAEGAPKALLDGKKNAKAAREFLTRVIGFATSAPGQ